MALPGNAALFFIFYLIPMTRRECRHRSGLIRFLFFASWAGKTPEQEVGMHEKGLPHVEQPLLGAMSFTARYQNRTLRPIRNVV